MDTKTFTNLALEGVDSLGFRLDQLGITSRINRHNLAAFLMNEQKHLEGEWDSIQAKVDRRRAQFDHLSQHVEARTDALIGPVLKRISRFRASQ
ncbi:hypothetical protein [Marinobacter sp. VGCF2001]|uniref:hypothetical protein n=1 Tax=Marinobacter sp. VGCF2001 TaxID=3417189 RepID=UPI003CEE6815